MDYKIVWTDSAIADLKAICSYVSQDNPSASTELGFGILNHVNFWRHFRSLAQPTLGAPVGGFGNLFLANIEFFMKWSANQRRFTYCVFGILRKVSPNSIK